MLFAITLFPKPVYPGRGSFNCTYYFPSFTVILLSAHLFGWFFIVCLKPSSLDDLNWFTSGPVGSSSLGFDIGMGYFFDFYLFVGDSNDIGGGSAQHFGRGDVGVGLSGDVLVFGL